MGPQIASSPAAETWKADRCAQPGGRGHNARMSLAAEHDAKSNVDGSLHTFSYGKYRLGYEIYGSGDRVLVWLHGLLLDAKQVLRLLDELAVDQVVLGGVSLGTNVSLLTTVQAPERVRGLIMEMPVLEWAVPAATLVFLPLLLGVHYARATLRLVSWVASRLPQSGLGPLDSFTSAASSDPEEIAAVLHGVLLGPIAPTIEQRRSITAPALVLGHGIDLIHSFSDAERLARQLPDARLIRTRTFAELWVRPARLTAEIGEFLDRVWAGTEPQKPPGEAVGDEVPA